MQTLATAYRMRSVDLLTGFLANDPGSQAVFHFKALPEPGGVEETWDGAEEVRIHGRMLEPWTISQDPVPSALWLVAFSITLTQETPWVDRDDLYASDENPEGLSPERWKAESAIYGHDILVQMQGETDYAISGRSAFVLIEDLQKPVEDEGKFLLLQWDDLGSNGKAERKSSWSDLKRMFR